MKKFLNRLFFFCLNLTLFLIIPILLLSEYDNTDRFTSNNSNILRIREASKLQNLDLLFLGNSYGYSGINTYTLDSSKIQSFNLGIASAGVDFYDLIMEDYLSHVDSLPARVMILVSPMNFSSMSDKWEKYRIHRYLRNPVSNWKLGVKYNCWSIMFQLYRESLKKGVHNILNDYRESVTPDSLNWHKGFVPNSHVFQLLDLPAEEQKYKKLKDDKFEPSQIEVLLNLANRFEAKGADVTFFEVPTNLIANYFSEDYLRAYEQGIQSLSQDYELLRIPTNLLTSDCYRDIDHMNTRGSIIVTQQIIRFIQSNNGAVN